MQSRLLSAAIVSALAVSAPAIAAQPQLAAAATARAQGLVNGPAAALVHRAVADDFVARGAILDADGTEHVRFERTYRGLPMIGGDVVLHSRNGIARSASQSLATTSRPALLPAISANDAIVEAGTRFGTRFSRMPTARLVVYARGATPLLAYEVSYAGVRADQSETDMRYFVDARTRKIIDQFDTIETAKPGPDGPSCAGPVAAVGTGKSLLLGSVSINTTKCGTRYQLLDSTRGGGYTTNMANRTTGFGAIFTDADNVWGNNTNTDASTIAVDAHYGVSKTWDYYKNVHGRNGIANDGKGALSRVHYGRNYSNASWNDACFCMTFGDGNGSTENPLVALDVAGHEMTHGVTSRSAELIYSGESGGLNEGTSDILGTMVEYYANDPDDSGDYLLGEKVYKQAANGTKALRYMFKPSLDGASPDCYRSDIGNLNVHYSSGLANHFYYLLAEGTVVPTGFGAGTPANLTAASLVCAGPATLTGIGRDAASKIWYRALTVHMTSNTNYAAARKATLDSASELYGATSAQYKAVAAAWSAVLVN